MVPVFKRTGATIDAVAEGGPNIEEHTDHLLHCGSPTDSSPLAPRQVARRKTALFAGSQGLGFV